MKCPYCNVEMNVSATTKQKGEVVAKWYICPKCDTSMSHKQAVRIAKDLRSLPPSDR